MTASEKLSKFLVKKLFWTSHKMRNEIIEMVEAVKEEGRQEIVSKYNVMERSCSNCSILQGDPKNEPTCQIQGRVIRIFSPETELCNRHTPIKEH